MKTLKAPNLKLRLGLVAVTFLAALPLQANPMASGIYERPVTQEIAVLITVSILLEAICWVFLLRRFQISRLFIWILGMQFITFPAFVGLLWLLDTMRPAFAAGVGEGLVVLVEGVIVYAICRRASASKQNASIPSLMRCWLVSLAGNICSATAFPLLKALHDIVYAR